MSLEVEQTIEPSRPTRQYVYELYCYDTDRLLLYPPIFHLL